MEREEGWVDRVGVRDLVLGVPLIILSASTFIFRHLWQRVARKFTIAKLLF